MRMLIAVPIVAANLSVLGLAFQQAWVRGDWILGGAALVALVPLSFAVWEGWQKGVKGARRKHP